MTLHLDRAPQFIAPSKLPQLDAGGVQFKGLSKASSGDRLCVFQPSSHKHVATEVSKTDFSKLMKLDPAKVRFASTHEAEFQAARAILTHAGVPGVEAMPVRLLLELAKRVGSGQLTPEVAAHAARTPNVAQREAILATADRSPHLAQLLARTEPGGASASQLQALRTLQAMNPAKADALAQAVLEHLADPEKNALPALDREIVKAGIEASGQAGARQTTSGLHDGQAARKTALSLNMARLVSNPDGSLNAGRLDAAIAELGAVTPQTDHTRLMARMLTRLKDDAPFAEQLQSIGAPRGAANPAHGMVRATLGLPPGHTVTQADARQAALAALLSDLRQSSVGSCFGTATAVMVHDVQPQQFLAELKGLIETGAMTKTIDGEEVSVSMSERVSTRELQQTIQLDGQGRVTKAGDKAVKPPAPLHEAPGMRAALQSLGVADKDMAATLAKATKALGKEKITPEALLRQVALGQVGLSASHASTVERVRKLDARIAELSVAARKGGPEGAAAQTRMDKLQAEQRKALESIDFRFETEKMAGLAQRMHAATDAYQGQMDNRLLRAWEYTLSSVLEKGEGTSVKQDAYQAITGEMRSNATKDPSKMGLDDFASQALFKSREIVIGKGWAGDKTSTAYEVRPGLDLPALDKSKLSDEDRVKFQPNKGTPPASDEAIFLNKFHTQLFEKYEAQLKDRIAVQYDAAAMGSGEIAADGSSDRGGFVLYDTHGSADPAEWSRLDTPDAYKRLAASVLRDVGREVVGEVAGDQSPEMQAFLTRFTEQVGAHAETEEFTALMVDRARHSSPVPRDSNPKPWEPFSGGKTHVTGKYFGHLAPKEKQVGTYGGFLPGYLKVLKEMGAGLGEQIGKHGKEFALPSRTSDHAFLARPGHPSLAGALEAPDTGAWIKARLEDPGALQAQARLDVGAQRPILDALYAKLEMGEGDPARVRIERGLAGGKTPKEMMEWLQGELDAHPPKAYARLDEDQREKVVELMIVKNLAPVPPKVVVADMNWEKDGGRVELSALFNPITGKVEPWFTHEDGSVLGINGRPGNSWFDWHVMSDPAEFGYT
ncbi:MAG TPA: hypothetical protein VLJ58_04040 [Ramlibacter sp.]|nr:hypothetical protein [Ramlibacter sp.]